MKTQRYGAPDVIRNQCFHLPPSKNGCTPPEHQPSRPYSIYPGWI